MTGAQLDALSESATSSAVLVLTDPCSRWAEPTTRTKANRHCQATQAAHHLGRGTGKEGSLPAAYRAEPIAKPKCDRHRFAPEGGPIRTNDESSS
jgi:hypothetical protein